MLLLNWAIDFIQKESLNSFLALVTHLFLYNLLPNLLKYGNIELTFWTKVQDQKIEDII